MSENKEQEENIEDKITTDDTQEDTITEVMQESDEKEVETKEEEVVEPTWEEKYNELNDKYHRVHADFENTKKRLEKEKYNSIDYAVEKFANSILAPIDSLEMALNHAKSADGDPKELLEKLEEGIDLTIKQFITAFEKSNLEIVDTDCEFDPNYHNAIMQVDSQDHDDGEIVQVMQKGYLLNSKVIRPAMVSICKR
jgi:molecular chaperone GrpE